MLRPATGAGRYKERYCLNRHEPPIYLGDTGSSGCTVPFGDNEDLDAAILRAIAADRPVLGVAHHTQPGRRQTRRARARP